MKLTLELDLAKINKAKIQERKFTTKDGQEVIQKIYKMELVELKIPKFLKKGEGYDMVKTHFLAEKQTKEERANKEKSNFVGDGIQFTNTSDSTADIDF